MHVLLSLLFLASTALTSPTPDPSVCTPTRDTKTARYDDLPFVEPGDNPIPPGYLGLNYVAFQVDQYDGFIPPTSGNQWTMAYGGKGNISVPDSPPKQTFDLLSFSYACVAGIPQPECAISIWGWKSSGRPIKRVITYPRLDPGHVTSDFKMNKTSFGRDWEGLKSVGFSIPINAGLALDDVSYTLRKGC